MRADTQGAVVDSVRTGAEKCQQQCEPGSGKEVAAQAIHDASPRA